MTTLLNRGGSYRSVAVTADAFNNLSDAGSSFVTLIGFKLASQEPDKEHPFGHGRIEYIAGLIVSFIIMLMGFELIKDSFDKIINPQVVTLSPLTFIILLISVFVIVVAYIFSPYCSTLSLSFS